MSILTKEDVAHEFAPADKLNDVQKNVILKLQVIFKDVASDIIDLVPMTADRTSALRKLLEAKHMLVHTVTHYREPVSPREANKKK